MWSLVCALGFGLSGLLCGRLELQAEPRSQTAAVTWRHLTLKSTGTNPVKHLQLISLILVRVFASVLYAWLWQHAQCSKIARLVLLLACVREVCLAVWPIMHPALYAQHARMAVRCGVAAVVVGQLLSMMPDQAADASTSSKTTLMTVAVVQAGKLMLNQDDILEMSILGGAILTATFMSHVSGSIMNAPRREAQLDVAEEALHFLLALIFLLLMHAAFMRLVNPAGLWPAYLPHGAPQQAERVANMQTWQPTLGQPSNLLTAEEATVFTSIRQQPRTMRYRRSRLKNVVLVKRVMVKLVGLAIYGGMTAQVWLHMLHHASAYGWPATRVLMMQQLWPSCLLFPVSVILQLTGLALSRSLHVGNHRTLLWLLFWQPLIARCISLLVEVHPVVHATLNPSTLIYFTLSSLAREDGQPHHAIRIMFTALLLLACKAIALGLIPPLAWHQPSTWVQWAGQLLALLHTNSIYVVLVAGSTLIYPLLLVSTWSGSGTNTRTRSYARSSSRGSSSDSGSCLDDSATVDDTCAPTGSKPLSRSVEASISQVASFTFGGPHRVPVAGKTVDEVDWKTDQDPGLQPWNSVPLVDGLDSPSGQVSPMQTPFFHVRLEDTAEPDHNIIQCAEWLGAVSDVIALPTLSIRPPPLPVYLSRALAKGAPSSRTRDKASRAPLYRWHEVAACCLLVWVRVYAAHSALHTAQAGQLAQPRGPAAAHLLCTAYTVAMLLVAATQPTWFQRHREALWVVQLGPCAVLQQLALHASLGGGVLAQQVSSTTTPQYLSHPVLSMAIMSILWPLLSLPMGWYKLALITRLGLTMLMRCSSLTPNYCTDAPFLHGLVALRLLLLMCALLTASHELHMLAPWPVNQATARRRLHSLPIPVWLRLLMPVLRNHTRTALLLVAVAGVLVLLPGTAPAAAALLDMEGGSLHALRGTVDSLIHNMLVGLQVANAPSAGPAAQTANLQSAIEALVLLAVGLMALLGLDLISSSSVQREHWLAAQTQAIESMGQVRLDSQELEDMVELLQERMVDLFAGSHASLLLFWPGPSGEPATMRTATLANLPHCMPDLLPEELQSVLCELLLRGDGAVLHVPDIQTVQQTFGPEPLLSALTRSVHASSICLAPLVVNGKLLGGLAAIGPVPGMHDSYFLRGVKVLASQLGPVILLSRTINDAYAGDLVLQDVMPAQVAEQLKLAQLNKRVEAWAAQSLTESEAYPLNGSFSAPVSASSFGANRAATRPLSRASNLKERLSDYPSTFNTAPLTSFVKEEQERLQLERSLNLRTSAKFSSLATKLTLPMAVCKQWHESVTILFADIVSYTAMSQELEAEQVMNLLHGLFSLYDSVADACGVYKVETIGDCYVAAGNLTTSDPQHADTMLHFAAELVSAANSIPNPVTGQPLSVRVGLHTGRVMSGVVGLHRSRYCLFGDTVNTSARMESTGLANHIQISDFTYSQLSALNQSKFTCRGEIAVKGKGSMRTYLLDASQALEDTLMEDFT